MTPRHFHVIALFATVASVAVASPHAWPASVESDVLARTESGWIRGLRRYGENGVYYASFRGVPYAKQPLGELRFKELQPAEPWELLDAQQEGPACLQTDKFYGPLMKPRGFSEACIFANVHVPLPAEGWSPALDLEPPYASNTIDLEQELRAARLPIFVFIHGGGFAFGSGDSDFHGPEYLVSRGVIVITFNYRLNVFGFLAMNTTNIPGNAGLRDMITLLRWVHSNARSFGGDPDNVTIAGQSAGSIAAHLLTLSEPAEGLFKRAILMSGVSTSGFYSPSPVFAQVITGQLLTLLGISSADPDEIHQQLIAMPAEKLTEANAFLLEQYGLITFVPTVESPLPGITTVLDDFPETLIAKGRGKDIALIIGFTDPECETFRPRLDEIDIAKKIKENPTLIVPSSVIFTTSPDMLPYVAKKIETEYFNGTINTDNFVNLCSDSYFEYPALDLAMKRAEAAAPTFLYRFVYDSDHSVVQEASGHKQYEGAGHTEDMTYVFKVNSIPIQRDSRDEHMKYRMTSFFVNFIKDREPWALWPPITPEQIVYENIEQPDKCETKTLSEKQQHLIKFFSNLRKTGIPN